MHTKIQKFLPAAGLAALSCIGANGQSADAIIDKLVDKGILTVDEANELTEAADKGCTSVPREERDAGLGDESEDRGRLPRTL
jgi:hypothetical protein